MMYNKSKEKPIDLRKEHAYEFWNESERRASRKSDESGGACRQAERFPSDHL
jgi:hypothetical protein